MLKALDILESRRDGKLLEPLQLPVSTPLVNQKDEESDISYVVTRNLIIPEENKEKNSISNMQNIAYLLTIV